MALEAASMANMRARATAAMLVSSLLLLFAAPSLSLDLCDESDCVNNTDLEICRPFGSSNKTPLYLMGFFPCNTRVRARGLTVAAQMAIRAVEKNNSILPNYSMRLSFNNTMCDRISATRAFITQLGERDVRHMIIGPGCSSGAVIVAENAPFRSLTQISPTATSIILSDKRLFPTFLRTIPSDNASIATITAVIREYAWQQVAIITERSPLFSNLSVVLSDTFEAENVRVITERLSLEARVDDPAIVMQQLNTSGARIVILNVFEDTAREIFCIAYRRGMIYPNYLYISYYQNSEYWWTDPIRNVSAYPAPECTALELTFAIFRSLAIDYFPVPSSAEENATTDVGYDYPRQFWNDFLGNLSSLNYLRSEALRQAIYVYDAIWAAAFALHNASQLLRDGVIKGQPLSLGDFNYSREDINQVILNSAKSLKYQGVSGRVSFNEYGDREPTGQIYQYRYTMLIDPENPPDPPLAPFSRINLINGRLIYEDGENLETVFPLPDGTPLAAKENFIHPALFALYTILAGVGIIFAVGCLIFNIFFRKKRIIKLSSPYLNVIICVGAILIYVDVILFGVDENVATFPIVDINCQATIWLASIGFSLFFGTILAKTWRVYYIFRNVQLKKKPIKDWALFIMVAVVVSLDIVLLITITIDRWRLRLERILLIRSGGDIPLIIDQCQSSASSYWLPALLAYKGLYLIIGLWLAARTYRVKIKELRDSKLIMASVVGICVVSVVLTLITLLLPTNRNTDYAVMGAFIMPLVTGVLFLLFVTRMIELVRDPSGEVQLASATSAVTGDQTEMTSVYMPYDNSALAKDEKTIAELKETIQSLCSQIEMRRRRAPKQDRALSTNCDNSDSQSQIEPARQKIQESHLKEQIQNESTSL